MTEAFSLWRGPVEVPGRFHSAQVILLAVATERGLRVTDLLSPCRNRPVVYARWEAMHLLRTTPKPQGGMRSLKEVARALGGLDHTTVLHGLRRRAELAAVAA